MEALIMNIYVPVVGAFIGYITNWLAIKMLFRPYNEKMIFGIKIPFTPGVIPKERNRVAANIGQAVGRHLLTDEVIKQKMLNEKTKEELSNVIKMYLKVEEIQLEQILQHIFEEQYDKYLQIFSKWCTNSLYKEIKQEDNQINITNKIVNYLQNNIANEPLNYWFPSEFNLAIKTVIDDKMPIIIDQIKKIKDDPIIEQKIKQSINEFLQQKLGSLGAMFVNMDNIYQVFSEKIEQALETEIAKEWIKNKLITMVDELEESSLNELFTEEQMQMLVTNTISQAINKLPNILSKEQLEKWINEFIIRLLKNNIKITETLQINLQKWFIKKYEHIVETKMSKFITSLDIPNMIENEMNSMDIKEIEDILLIIVNKELKAITWFGALLGFVMGILSTVFR